jgi:hypothetical protein
MSRVRFRQVARLEKRALPYIERKRRYAKEREASRRESNFVIPANLALLILYGDPRIGEPLTYAWRRCVESKEWKACRKKHPDYIGTYGRDEEGPFTGWAAKHIAQYFRKYLLPELPGADETEKLNAVFTEAPAWLLWFAHAEWPILGLGFKLPDLSSMSRFARPDLSDCLPDGAFEWRRLPDGVEDRTISLILELTRKQLAHGAELTPRERVRALRFKESGAMSGSGRDSSQLQIDEPPDGDAVAALLRGMSQVSGVSIGNAVAVASQ